MYIFGSSLHIIFTKLKNYITLSSYERRYVILGEAPILGWGHKSISENVDEANKLLHLFLKIEMEMMDYDENIAEDENFFEKNLDISFFDKYCSFNIS